MQAGLHSHHAKRYPKDKFLFGQESSTKNPWITFGSNLPPLGFTAVYFSGGINGNIADFLVRTAWDVIVLTLFSFDSSGEPVWLLLWIGIHATWGLSYLYLGRWGLWLLFALAGLVITSGGLVFAALESEGLDGTSRSTASSQVWILGVGLFTAAVVLLTSIDTFRRLRARSSLTISAQT